MAQQPRVNYTVSDAQPAQIPKTITAMPDSIISRAESDDEADNAHLELHYVDRTLWKLGTLPPGLLTSYGLTEPLDPSWHVLGFGCTNVDPQLIERGTVLHFNGNSKPWSKIGIEKYKPL